MSNITIPVASLKNTRNQLSATIDKLDTANNKALTASSITSDQHSQVFNGVQDLRNTLNGLDVALINTIINSITVPSDSPAARINASIGQLDTAINSIQNISNVLAKITEVISDTQFLIGLL